MLGFRLLLRYLSLNQVLNLKLFIEMNHDLILYLNYDSFQNILLMNISLIIL